ncbi:porphobilinogen deaminase [Mesorhizobium amorphae CCNWGS0123]|uniref:Hydroxymethylbilane synthase n=2 Tax=Mesorhizobium TaxID=68287 RepID=G6Y5Q3_9HYPH|nr:hypothetical protein A6B35_32890 [Mesorhizobium amorphae CCNWGS0123]EHH12917.1 porphobilinogen deaminase [Mesorhizobium amorphae CCNWGS0123]
MAIVVAGTAERLIKAVEPRIEVEICPFVSEGDLIKGDLKLYGGKGTFIKDLERRLLANEIDCAIHALKDIPGDVQMHEELMLIAFLSREDPRDALVLRSGLSEEEFLAKQRVRIGTSAPRRRAAALRLFPDCAVELSRGNVNTRLKNLDSGLHDALILSGSGLDRVGFHSRIARLFSYDEVLPAAGQGILVLQIRREDLNRCSYLRIVNNEESENAAAAEREVLAQLNGNCHSAIAAHCWAVESGGHKLTAAVFDSATGNCLEAAMELPLNSKDFTELGAKVAEQLIKDGCRKFLTPVGA